VLLAPLEGFEDEHIERSLKELDAVLIGFAGRHRV